MKTIILIFFVGRVLGFNIKTHPDTGKILNKQSFIFIQELNLDIITDEHGDHDNTMEVMSVLNHMSKEREFGKLFGYFL